MVESSNNDAIIETIRKNLSKINYNYDALSDKDKQYLFNVETAITKIFELEQHARNIISKNTVSVKGVAKKTNIARQTLYNNTMLKEYINYRSKAFEKVDASRKDTAKDIEIKKLIEEITALHKRDVELEETKRQLSELKKRCKEQEAIIISLRKEARTNNIHWN